MLLLCYVSEPCKCRGNPPTLSPKGVWNSELWSLYQTLNRSVGRQPRLPRPMPPNFDGEGNSEKPRTENTSAGYRTRLRDRTAFHRFPTTLLKTHRERNVDPYTRTPRDQFYTSKCMIISWLPAVWWTLMTDATRYMKRVPVRSLISKQLKKKNNPAASQNRNVLGPAKNFRSGLLILADRKSVRLVLSGYG